MVCAVTKILSRQTSFLRMNNRGYQCGKKKLFGSLWCAGQSLAIAVWDRVSVVMCCG